MKLVSQLKDEVAGLLQGTNLNNITNLNGALERAAKIVVQKASIPEAVGRQNYSLYWGVYDYPAPTSIFDSSIIDLRPQGNSRTSFDYVYRKPIEQFDRTKSYTPSGYSLTFEYNKGVPIMRVSQNKSQAGIILDPMNDTTGWTAGGTASSLATDEASFYEQPAALKFNLLSGGGIGSLSKTITTQDLTSYKNVGVAFLALRVPTGASLSSIELRLGSSSANFYTVTVTQGFLGAWPDAEYTLVAFNLATATTYGTPDITKITHINLRFTYTANLTNVNAGKLFLSLPFPHQLIYETAAVFLQSGVLSSTITDDTDQITLNDAAYLIYIYECAMTIAVQSGGGLSSNLVQIFQQTLGGIPGKPLGLYDYYRADNPSQINKMIGNYYD